MEEIKEDNSLDEEIKFSNFVLGRWYFWILCGIASIVYIIINKEKTYSIGGNILLFIGISLLGYAILMVLFKIFTALKKRKAIVKQIIEKEIEKQQKV